MKSLRNVFIVMVSMFCMTVFAQNTPTVEFCEADKGEVAGKSTLTSSVEYQSINNIVNVYAYNNNIFVAVDLTTVDGQVIIYDITGKEILNTDLQNKNLNKYSITTNKTNIFVVKVIVDNKEYTKKVYIK